MHAELPRRPLCQVLADLLLLLDPMQGRDSALLALREAECGAPWSLAERFNVPRRLIGRSLESVAGALSWMGVTLQTLDRVECGADQLRMARHARMVAGLVWPYGGVQ